MYIGEIFHDSVDFCYCFNYFVTNNVEELPGAMWSFAMNTYNTITLFTLFNALLVLTMRSHGRLSVIDLVTTTHIKLRLKIQKSFSFELLFI